MVSRSERASAGKGRPGPAILVVDDHPIWRDSLTRLLARKKAGRVVGQASDGNEAVEMARLQRPDVVIMDVDLPNLDGIEATRRVHDEHPEARVLFLSAMEARDDVVAALHAGASGYLLKTSAPEEVVDAVRRVHAGELVFPAALASIVRQELQRGGEAGPRPRRRKDTHAHGRNLFVREGEFWTIDYGGETVRMKDSKGFRYLAHLLRSPGEGFHVMELVSATNGVDPSARGRNPHREPDLNTDQGAAIPSLDRGARDAYRARLHELSEQVEEAEAWNDAERAARAREEMELLTAELARAVGLGGRDRMTASASERARVNVTRAVSSALSRIEAEHPTLAKHLAGSIRTGTFCSYEPGGAVAWRL